MTDFRRISIDDHDGVIVNPGKEPSLEWLRISELVLDQTYQRPLGRQSWTAINQIAAHFSWSHFSPVVVSILPNGTYAIIDGQHRTHAAALVGIDLVPCLVLDLTRSQQAASFAKINGNVTAITPFHIYKAELAAGEPWAIASRDVAISANCRLMTSPASSLSRKPRDIYTVSLFKSHVLGGRVHILKAGLTALSESQIANELKTWNLIVLKPWFFAIQQVPSALDYNLTDFVTAHSPLDVLQKVDVLRAQPKFEGEGRAALFTESLTTLLRAWAGNGGKPL